MMISDLKAWSRGLCLFGGLAVVMTAAANAAPAESELSAEQEATIQQAAERRQNQLAQVEEMLKPARQLRREKKFAEADKAYQAARAVLNAEGEKQIPGVEADRARAALAKELSEFVEEWSAALMKEARELAAAGRYEDAMAAAGEAVLIDPRQATAVDRFNENCRRALAGQEYRDEIDLNKMDPTLESTQLRIDQLFRNARSFYAAGKYQDARIQLEQLYLLDPFNTEATQLLRLVYQKMYRAGILRQEASVEEQFAYNNWNWVEPIFPTTSDSAGPQKAEVKTLTSDNIYSRLERIVFPNVEFDKADIMTVIRYLNDRSKRYDPDKEGVRITTGFDQTTAEGLNKITMSFTRIPMSEALRYLCQDVGLKYKIDGDGVVIGPNVDSMQTQYFTVRGDLIASISGGGGGEGDTSEPVIDPENFGSEGGGDTDFESVFEERRTAGRKQAPVSEEELKRYFSDRGIQFAEGASIKYFPSSNKLAVRNTVEYLRRMEDLLRELAAIKTPLVMVELKVVELTENDWQELGFDWAFNTFTDSNPSSYSSWNATINNPLRSTGTMGGTTVGGNQSGIIGVDDNGAPIIGENSSGVSGTTNTESNRTLINNLKIFPNFGTGIIDGVDINLALTINAVSQNLRSEVLSAPKIVTISGKTARISMSKQYYFPDSWEAPEIDTDNDFVSVTPPIPEWTDDSSEIGIVFEVTPTVSPDNYTVMLDLHPIISSYIGQTDDSVRVEQGIIDLETGTRTPYSNGSQVYRVWMPIISKREIEVTVKVYDGETIVLGGMIDNKTETLSDKWPFLGDIPLLGRLFSSQYDKKKKTNMLIFVTTRLVNNDGVPVRRNQPRGYPDFDR